MAYTYDTLIADVIANMEEDSAEFVSALPTIIERAQIYLQGRIDSPEILRITEVSVSASTRELSLPSDLKVLKSIHMFQGAGYVNLLQQTNEYLVAYWPDFASCAPTKYFAPKDNLQIFLAPTPPEDSVANIEYVPKVTVLTSAAPSNWFSENAEAAFFAAAMMYANMWTKNPNATNIWKGAADEELSVLNNTARRARRSDDTDRSGGSPENNLAEGSR